MEIVGSKVEGSSVLIHPLVLVNISEHHTRLASMESSVAGSSSGVGGQSSGPRKRASGILLGAQTGRIVELQHSFELLESESGGFDQEFQKLRLEQYKQIFPDYGVMGWYASSDGIRPTDIDLHQSIMNLNESPVYLVLNPIEAKKNASKTSTALIKQLPIEVFETDSPPTRFTKVPFSFQSTDSERVAVDHVIRHASTAKDTGSSNLVQHLTSLHRAVTMLDARVDVIKRFLEATAKGEVPWDPELLRRAAEVCKEMPSMSMSEFTASVDREANDVQIVAYLSAVTRSLCVFKELVDKVMMYDFYQGTKAISKRDFGPSMP